jgi:hypothetical protein
MKAAFLASAFLLSTLSSAPPAHADDDYGRETLMQVRVYGGHTPQPMESLVKIQRNGKLISSRRVGQQAPVTELWGRLSRPRVEALTRLADSFSAGPLQLADPDAPQCADAPTADFEVFRSDRQQIIVARNRDCRKAYVATGQAWAVERILDGISALGYE